MSMPQRGYPVVELGAGRVPRRRRRRRRRDKTATEEIKPTPVVVEEKNVDPVNENDALMEELRELLASGKLARQTTTRLWQK